MSLSSSTTNSTDTVAQPIAEPVPESWLRAVAWVAQADQERVRTHTANVAQLVQEWRDPRWPTTQAEDVKEGLTRTYALMVARNTFAHYVPSRFGKILRTRFRRYHRLKYLYELDHPQFPCPIVPHELWALDTISVYVRIFQFFHELEHPPFSHLEFPEDPALEFWHHGSEITGSMDTRGLNGWNTMGRGSGWAQVATPHPASVLTEDDDESSPVAGSVPLP
ncbi:hypothetical protein DFH08DRAFT_953437 [Mycena albidolilacea]|uniref:Uncharacterized protein n=1 Tax=Mycena albidolilacea TaxID=1033008 RepID=A0AAD7F0M2_9AGAR|nr:hypothetical protein DFH08DRAFT_953437 [Mycena albidolilacea]